MVVLGREREREKGKEKEIRNTLRDGMRKRDKGRKRAIETETEGNDQPRTP